MMEIEGLVGGVGGISTKYQIRFRLDPSLWWILCSRVPLEIRLKLDFGLASSALSCFPSFQGPLLQSNHRYPNPHLRSGLWEAQLKAEYIASVIRDKASVKQFTCMSSLDLHSDYFAVGIEAQRG